MKITMMIVAMVLWAMPLHAAVPDDMTAYADNAILNAAEHGYKKVTLVFGHANPGDIEDLAQDLRSRGYRIDEEAALLNPMVIKVQALKSSAMAKAVAR
jgi:hypothetical protein